jgi:hypothetical protein
MNASSLAAPPSSPTLSAGLPASSRVETLSPAAGIQHSLLLIPHSAAESPEVLEAARRWVAEAGPGRGRAPNGLPVLLRLYNVELCWSPDRSAAIATEERFDSIRDAIADFTRIEGELASIEEGIEGAWPAYEADLPLAYGFTEATAGLREGLQQRYGKVMSLHGRLARLSRSLTQPAPQPPTLAGQIGERLRERLRVLERDEVADGELDVLASHYDACGQRASDFMIARREQMLSWTIIIILSLETLLFAVDLLSSASAGS